MVLEYPDVGSGMVLYLEGCEHRMGNIMVMHSQRIYSWQMILSDLGFQAKFGGTERSPVVDCVQIHCELVLEGLFATGMYGSRREELR